MCYAFITFSDENKINWFIYEKENLFALFELLNLKSLIVSLEYNILCPRQFLLEYNIFCTG